MEILISSIGFFKLLLLFMAILFVIKQAFSFYKSMAKRINFESSTSNSILLWVSIAYILTLIFL